MNNITKLTLEIARLPIAKVAGAYYKLISSTGTFPPKGDMCKELANDLFNGKFSMADIESAPDWLNNTSTGGVDPATVAKVDATANVASKASTDALEALATVRSVRSTLTKLDTTVNDSLSQMNDKINALRVDDHAVKVTIDTIVGDHFKKFTKLVEKTKAQERVAQATAVHRVGQKTCKEVFGIDVSDRKGRPLMIDVWNHPDAPRVDPDFIWSANILQHLLLSDRTGENLWFGGDKGTGKSETARQFSARTGRAFKRINFHKHTTVEEYVGGTGLENGKTVFQPKDFLTAYADPSTVILLDEITNADPAELATLNGFLEPNACVSFGGITHTRADGVLVFVADNTFGNGDDSGRYAGTRLQNSALVDRFSRVIKFEFLPDAKEIEAIVKRSGCNPKLAKIVHSAIKVARQKVQSAEIVDAPSIRSAIAFARALEVLHPRDAWESTVVARQPEESHATLLGIFDACINVNEIEQLI